MDKEQLLECTESSENGVYLDIRVSPGSSTTKINGVNPWRNQFEFSVKEKAVQGEANKALLALFTKSLDIQKKNVSIVRGKTTKSKRIFFEGVDRTELIDKIKRIYGELE